MLNLRATATLYTKEKNQRGINIIPNNSGKKDIIDVCISLI